MSNFVFPLKEKIGSDYNAPINMDHVKTYYRSTLSWGEEVQLQITFEIANENLVFNYWVFESSEDRESEMNNIRLQLESESIDLNQMSTDDALNKLHQLKSLVHELKSTK